MFKYENDSRKVLKGQTFIAIKGLTVDGHDYIDKAIELGAKHITAFDADSRAVKNTLKNAERNCFSNIEAYWLDFMQTNCKADILIANLPLQIGLFCLPKMKESINDGGLIITSWHKENPKKELTIDFEIVDYIEGIDYDCYVLKSNK